MKTPVCEMLGIEFPIFAFTHCRDVVAAVSKAGGFGVLGATAHSPEDLEIDLKWIEEEIGDAPYGVDLLLPQKYVGSEAGGMDKQKLRDMIPQGHRDFLDDMMQRYDVPERAALDPGTRRSTGSAGGLGISETAYMPLIDVSFAHKTKLIASALGPPPGWIVERAHKQDIYVAALAGKPEHAVRHKNAGADIIIAQGAEAGGHTGQIGTMVLVPEVVDAVAPVPVLAAGGIGTGRQMAASFALGAAGVWCGSVWLTTEEAETNPVVKEKYLAAGSSDTVRSRCFSGKPARQLRTAWTDEWEATDAPETLPMPLQPMLIGPYFERINQASHKEGSGANKLVNYFVGQIVGQMNQVKSSTQIVFDMIDELIDTTDSVNDIMSE